MAEEEQSAFQTLLVGMLKRDPAEQFASKDVLHSEWFTNLGHPEMLRMLKSPPES
jgi:hypothetical protein